MTLRKKLIDLDGDPLLLAEGPVTRQLNEQQKALLAQKLYSAAMAWADELETTPLSKRWEAGSAIEKLSQIALQLSTENK